MSLLVGILSSAGLGPINTSITGYSGGQTGSNSFTLTGADTGQLYVVIHTAVKANGGLSAAPDVPSGFTSIASYYNSTSWYSARVSYRILSTNLSTVTIPSVTNADAHIANGLVISTNGGSFTGLTSDTTGFSYLTSGDPASVSLTIDKGIGIGFYAGYNDTPGTSSTLNATPSVSIGGAQFAPNPQIFLNSGRAKVFNESTAVTYDINGSAINPILSTLISLTPTIS